MLFYCRFVESGRGSQKPVRIKIGSQLSRYGFLGISHVHPELDNGDGTFLDLFGELKKRHHLLVAFTRTGEKEPVSVMIPVYKFAGELQKVTIK